MKTHIEASGGTNLLNIVLSPGETVMAEPSAMIYKESGIEMSTSLGEHKKQGAFTRLVKAAGRGMIGESAWLVHFTNEDDHDLMMGFALPAIGQIKEIDLSRCGGILYVRKESFLCAETPISIGVAIETRIGKGLFSGMGFVIQRIKGEGKVWIQGGGVVTAFPMSSARVNVDPECLLGYSKGITTNIERIGGIKTMMFSGEKILLPTLSGSGTVYLQTVPPHKLAQYLAPPTKPKNT